MIDHHAVLALLTAAFTFLIIVIASNELAKGFQKLKLPLITGFILIGVIAGPDILKMIPRESLHKLYFIDEFALAFIAFAAGNEMFLKELRQGLKNIIIMTAAQFFVTFLVSFGILLLIADYVPFMANQPQAVLIGISLLMATIFIARSPASAIAVINELKAKGPFTQVALGVTILKDILVIILFTITYSVGQTLISGTGFDAMQLFVVLLELIVSIVVGIIYAKIIVGVFSLKMHQAVEYVLFLLLGWSIYLLSSFVEHQAEHLWHIHFHIEALLAGIVASFYITNFTKYRLHLQKVIEVLAPYVYVVFFTKVGADIELIVLLKYWKVAVLLFGVRLFAIMVASITGGIAIRDKLKNVLLSWTPYITQAGVSLGLITIVASAFPQLGREFETIMVAVIIINQFVGPPLMKWAIVAAGEAHKKEGHKFDGIRDVLIFGLENLSINLAHQLEKQNWEVKIITDEPTDEYNDEQIIEIVKLDEFDEENLEKIGIKQADAVVLLMTDYKNYQIAQTITSYFDVPTLIVRIEDFDMYQKFRQLGALVVEPSTAMVNLLEHFVISPTAASILLGLESEQQTLDIEILNPELHGKPLRDIRLPLGVLVISVTRNGQSILTHGYTRLRLHDVVTVVGKPEQLEQVRVKFQF